MSEGEIDAIEQRARLATPGSWHANGDYVVAGDAPSQDWGTASTAVAQGLTPVDAEFIAHARSDVPQLLREVRRLRERIGESGPRSG